MRAWLSERFRVNYLLGLHSPSLIMICRCRCHRCRWARRRAWLWP